MIQNNNSEKHCISARRLRRIRSKKARKLLVCLTALLCMAFVGSTIAFLVTQTGQVTNTFQGSKVACVVIENGTGGTGEFDGKVKTNVRIQNTGDTQSYIRAKVVVTWMKIDSNNNVSVSAIQPVAGTDYRIIYAQTNSGSKSSNWVLAADGYWYYIEPINPGEETTDYLIGSCTLINKPSSISDDYYLSVEIVASAIQSTPTDVVKTQWSSNGKGVTDVNGTTLTVAESTP